MDHFHYRDGVLHAEDVPLPDLARAIGTPSYVYSRTTLTDHYDRIVEAFAPIRPLVCFAMKSSSNLAILRTLVARGAGLDLVSGGELHRARAADATPARCVFAGVGKTDEEILDALRFGIGWINVESEAELANVARLARTSGTTCRVALRVNPDVDPQTHRHTTTGKRETKFGVALEDAKAVFARYGADDVCRLCGVHVHIGSPVNRIDAYVESITKTLTLIDAIEAAGNRVEMLDIGGGFGANYVSDEAPPAAAYAARIVPLLESRVARGLEIVIEPGRTISANAGVLLTRVLYRKRSGTKTFVICDGGMHTLLRPSHYDAFHFIWPCRVPGHLVPLRREAAPPFAGLETVDVVGPICETGDFLARDRVLPSVDRGDLLAVFGAGAYGMSMASRYNSMPLPAEAMVAGTEATLIRRRETLDDLVRHELDPSPITQLAREEVPA